ncbi:hypothetical protein P3T76_000974 [Phytophthora citrophthora]|uniref:Uncharacterized protein n=1 Tax=Phytophthora citrophthora TaxID=4793 RepID=A0AAD9GXN5_9STRA|nr:hypothetical protein P3T76_000974 [Phytophthora citrophthora]
MCVGCGLRMVVNWPSGLRRQFKALVRKGVGSNPTLANFFFLLSPCAPLYTFLVNSDASDGTAVTHDEAQLPLTTPIAWCGFESDTGPCTSTAPRVRTYGSSWLATVLNSMRGGKDVSALWVELGRDHIRLARLAAELWWEGVFCREEDIELGGSVWTRVIEGAISCVEEHGGDELMGCGLRMVVNWPSGLRRQFKALVRKGVGSNPTLANFFFLLSPCAPLYTFLVNSDASDGTAVTHDEAQLPLTTPIAWCGFESDTGPCTSTAPRVRTYGSSWLATVLNSMRGGKDVSALWVELGRDHIRLARLAAELWWEGVFCREEDIELGGSVWTRVIEGAISCVEEHGGDELMGCGLRMVVNWPSGLRRQFKALVRKGVGSNPTLANFFFLLSPCAPLYTFLVNSDASDGTAVTHDEAQLPLTTPIAWCGFESDTGPCTSTAPRVRTYGSSWLATVLNSMRGGKDVSALWVELGRDHIRLARLAAELWWEGVFCREEDIELGGSVWTRVIEGAISCVEEHGGDELMGCGLRMVVNWPSGLRRQFKALVRKGVGSNPTLANFFFLLSPCAPLYTFLVNSDASDGTAVTHDEAQLPLTTPIAWCGFESDTGPCTSTAPRVRTYGSSWLATVLNSMRGGKDVSALWVELGRDHIRLARLAAELWWEGVFCREEDIELGGSVWTRVIEGAISCVEEHGGDELMGCGLRMVVNWPSGLRRQFKALVRKGVGSNPTLANFFFLLSPCAPLYTFLVNSDASDGTAVTHDEAQLPLTTPIAWCGFESDTGPCTSTAPRVRTYGSSWLATVLNSMRGGKDVSALWVELGRDHIRLARLAAELWWEGVFCCEEDIELGGSVWTRVIEGAISCVEEHGGDELMGCGLRMVVNWPSGLRRQFKALVRKGVGSNPTLANFFFLLSPCAPLYTFLVNSDASDGTAVTHDEAQLPLTTPIAWCGFESDTGPCTSTAPRVRTYGSSWLATVLNSMRGGKDVSALWVELGRDHIRLARLAAELWWEGVFCCEEDIELGGSVWTRVIEGAISCVEEHGGDELMGCGLRMVVNWPSGLRRQFKALVRKGVGSNPTLANFFFLLSSCFAALLNVAGVLLFDL